MTIMRKINQKYLNETILEILQMEKLSNVTISIIKIGLKDCPANVQKAKKNYFIEFEGINPYCKEFREILEIEIKTQHGLYLGVEGFFVKRYDNFEKFNFHFTIELNSIVKGDKKETVYHRMVLQTKKNVTIMDSGFLPVQGYSSEHAPHRGLINVSVQRGEYDIFEVTNNDKRFIFIDCKDKIDIDTFYDQTLSILVSLGFITTYFFQNECYIISSEQNDYKIVKRFEYRSLRKSIKLQFNFLGSNPYNYFDRNEAKHHYEEMPAVTQDCLNSLINLVYKNDTIRNCLFVYIVANDNPLDTQPACISVALEGLCNVVSQANEDRINPIKDKSLAKELTQKLMEVVDVYKDKIDTEGIDIIKKNIDKINSPTNMDKLVKPFHIMGYSLKKYEITAIKNRNNFLHGRITVKVDKEIENKDSLIYQINFTTAVLKKLFYILLLKYVGYSGTIINNIKVDENIFGKQEDEDILIKLN